MAVYHNYRVKSALMLGTAAELSGKCWSTGERIRASTVYTAGATDVASKPLEWPPLTACNMTCSSRAESSAAAPAIPLRQLLLTAAAALGVLTDTGQAGGGGN
jgi:hypothetical protein